MNPSVTIRPCEARDLPAVASLLSVLAETAHAQTDFELDKLSRLFERMEDQPEVYLNLVACRGETVVGFLSVIFYLTLFHEGGTALINELVVSGEARGQGVGRALVEAAHAEALARGMDELEVGTETSNTAAQAFYRACGFDQTYLLLGMEWEREDEGE